MRCNNVLVLSTPLLQVTDSAAEGWMSEHAMKRERKNLAGRVLEQRATRIKIQLWPRISVLFRPLARHCIYKSPARGSVWLLFIKANKSRLYKPAARLPISYFCAAAAGMIQVGVDATRVDCSCCRVDPVTPYNDEINVNAKSGNTRKYV